MRRRRSTSRTTASPSLFPFLAVLICTMGVLIVLLVLGVQQAQVQARDVAEEKLEQQAEFQELRRQEELKREDYLWRADVLQESRAQKTDQLESSRLALSHLEEQIRQLEDQLKNLQERHRQVHQDAPSTVSNEESKAALAALQAQIDRAQQQLDEARRRYAQKQGSYSLVPYKGPNGTDRYPIYLECFPQGVVIQPEGVPISLADLQGMSGPGNPLDACLRAIRERLYKTVGAENVGEPYPLLIVRPNAVRSYALARHAMTDWEDAFGYELLAEDIELAYPEADQQLAALLRRTIIDARERQQALAQAMPSRFPGGGNGLGGGRSGNGPAESGNPAGQWPNEGSLRQPTGTGTAQNQKPETRPAGQAGAGGAMVRENDIHARAAGWGLPREDPAVTGITRPIYIHCYADRLVIVPRRGERGRKRTLELTGPLAGQVDEFVKEVWNHMESWGIAVAGGYWRPVLTVEVFPGGSARFSELTRLLKRSGIVVHQYR